MSLSDQMTGGGHAGGAAMPSDRPGPDDKSAVIELTVPAHTAYLVVVRTATAGLAARLSYTLDEIEDLRIAIDEACVMLLGLPGPIEPAEATLTCQFRVSPEALAVTVSAQVADKAALP